MTFHGPELHWYWMSDPGWMVWHSCWNNYWIITNYPIISYYLILFIYQYHCMAKKQKSNWEHYCPSLHIKIIMKLIHRPLFIQLNICSWCPPESPLWWWRCQPAPCTCLMVRIWEMKDSAQLMQTKSRMLLTHPSATAFATSSVKTSLPSTSCTIYPFHCWCIAEEGTSKADFQFSKHLIFYLQGSQKSCPHQWIHFRGHPFQIKISGKWRPFLEYSES